MCITWDLTKKEQIEKTMRQFKTNITIIKITSIIKLLNY